MRRVQEIMNEGHPLKEARILAGWEQSATNAGDPATLATVHAAIDGDEDALEEILGWERAQNPPDFRSVIKAIQEAQNKWVSCDWTHYNEDTGETCEGGDIDHCDSCLRADEDAAGAAEYGDLAARELRRGNPEEALRLLKEAKSLEMHWGAAPAWGPVVDALVDALEERA